MWLLPLQGAPFGGVHQPRVSLLRHFTLGYMLLPLRGVKINVSKY